MGRTGMAPCDFLLLPMLDANVIRSWGLQCYCTCRALSLVGVVTWHLPEAFFTFVTRVFWPYIYRAMYIGPYIYRAIYIGPYI